MRYTNKTTFSPLWRLSIVGCLVVLTSCQAVDDSNGLIAGGVVDRKAAAASRTALASEYLQNNQLDAAKRSLELALKSDPNSAEAYHMMAILLQREGSPENHAKAEKYFKQAIRLQDDFAAAYNNYGVYLRGDGRLVEAMKAFDTAGSTLGYASRGQALENLGRTALMMGDLAKAKNSFQRAIGADGNSVVSHFELAEILFQENNVAGAANEFQSYKTLLGEQKMGARSLWLGVRIAAAIGDNSLVQMYAQLLNKEYPNSPENIQSTTLLKGIMKSWQ